MREANVTGTASRTRAGRRSDGSVAPGGPGGGMGRCPAHDDRAPSLSVGPGRRVLPCHFFAGCETEAILPALHWAGHRLPDTVQVRAEHGPG